MMTEKEIEAMEDKIHAMSIAELRAMAKNAEFVMTIGDVGEQAEEEPILEEDLLLQSMSTSQLRTFFDNGTLVNLNDKQEKMLAKLLRKQKAAKTGLSKKVIKKIETNKHKATLEEIIAYCKGLQINFKDFLPELFGQSV